MRTVVIAGGPDISVDFLSNEITAGDFILCADSGVDYAVASGIVPHKVMGDLDSISEEGKNFIDSRRIPLEIFPVEKDMTDTELALRSVSKEDDILLVCSLTGRIDHVISNVNLAGKLHAEGYNLTVTDGVSHIIPLCGNESVNIGVMDSENMTVSLIPYDEEVTGVTTKGLYYELNDAPLKWGSSFSVSNKVVSGGTSFEISVKSGKLGVFVTTTT